MKKFTIIGFLVLTLLAASEVAPAFQSVKLSDEPSGASLLSQDQTGLSLRVDIGSLDFIDVNTADGQFIMIASDELVRSHRIGEPNLPTNNKLISIPFGCEVIAEVTGSESELISLEAMGLTSPIIPVQPSLSKSEDAANVPFEYNRELYTKSGFYSQPLVSVEEVGIMRALRLARVVVAPFEYDPVAKQLRVYKSVTVRITYLHPDWPATRQMQERLYSPFFTPVYQQVFNYAGQESMLLDDITRYPVKYIIVSHRMFEAQLQPFIEWKTKKGFTVVTGYTDVIGTTNTQIKAWIRDIYNTSDPAPSFVLFVGDAQQIPPFSFSGHISDLSFCEYTNDNIPEIYYGRFSAQNTGQLQPQIDKTLEYEQYLMPDPSFLGEVTMIAGVDANYAPTYGNGQINYGTETYFNSAHGLYSNTWLYPQSSGPVESAVIQTINDGLSYINYTAHGGHDSWSDPSLTVSNVNALTNAHKYPLAVGNCCLTNTFGTDYSTPCLGEAWLQAANKGAIGYIGGSNSTYWDEDYWWGVGYKAVVVHPTYSASSLGAYDGVFHDHGEPVTKHYVTNDAINFAGNLAVTQSGSSRIAYYWQIYHLMGDPSVMTYIGVPPANAITHPATLLMTETSMSVQAAPGSYIGVSVNGVLHGVAHVDQTGSVIVSLTPFAAPGTADIVITAQNKVPYISTIQIIAPTGPYVVYDQSSINDASGNNNGLIDCGESIVLGVQLKNVGPNTANGVSAVLSVADTFVTITDSTESYGVIPGNNGTLNRPTAFAFNVSGRTPDMHNISFTLTVSGVALDTWISNFVLPVHSPTLQYVSVQIIDTGGNGILDPGETAQVIVTLNNDGSGQANTISGLLSETDPYVSISDPNGSFGSIAPGANGSNAGDVFSVAANSSCPMGHAMSFVLALSSPSGYSASVTVPMVVGDRVVFFSDDFSTNQGWTGLGGSAEWTIGPATGGQGGDSYGEPDPAQDNSPTTDNRVMGNDLTSGTGGDYAGSISATQWITSPIIDCSNYTSVQMTYYHWLGVERNTYDHAYLQAFNGTTWISLFENGTETIDETSWNMEQYDLTAIADQNADFRLRFGLGITDGSWNFCGWNIDDIELKGYSQGSSGSPNLVFSISNLADSLLQGDSVTQSFRMRNTGDGILRVNFTCTDEWLHFNGAQVEIAPLDSAAYNVTIASASLNPGAHNCNLSFTSNDPDTPTGQIPVYVYIYVPNLNITQTLVRDTLLTDQQSSVPLVLGNTGPGRLFYTVSVDASASLATAAPISLASISDSFIEPIGINPASDKQGSVDEPLYPPVILDQGGPDTFGHTWIDSDEPGGPAVAWVDISGSGTPVILTDDSSAGPFAIGFSFPYFENSYSELFIGSNGLVSFGAGTSSRFNTSIPNTGVPNDFLPIFWDDLAPHNGGTIRYYQDTANDRFIVSYDGIPLYTGGGALNFQVILYPNGKIDYNYAAMDPGTGAFTSSSIGIENAAGNDGLQVVYNAAYIHSNLTIVFHSAPAWVAVTPESGSIEPYSQATLQVNFNSTGLADSVYTGNLLVSTNDPDSPNLTIPVELYVGEYLGGDCIYVPGDINNNATPNGIDVVFAVIYFKGGDIPPVACDCPPSPSPFYPAGDVNGNCVFNGIDITYFVNYLKGIVPTLLYCPTCPPAPAAAPAMEHPATHQLKARTNQASE